LTTAAANVVIDKSVAVLPFLDMSEKRDQEYFADGTLKRSLIFSSEGSSGYTSGSDVIFYF